MKKIIILIILLLPVLSHAQVSPNITRIEYYIDGDPGFGFASNTLSFSPDSIIANLQSNNLLSIVKGMHILGIRSLDVNGIWSHTNFTPFFIADTVTQSNLTYIEYFWKADAGFGTGYISTLPFSVSDTANYWDSIPVPILGTTPRTDTLYARSYDSHLRYSHTNYIDTVHITGTTGLNEIAGNYGISIYPNPFVNQITVCPKENQKMRLILYSQNGQLIMDKIIRESMQINTQSLSPGAYTIFIWAEKQKIYRSTIIKQ